MDNAYLVCMILGIVFPLLSLIFDIFDDVLDALFSGLEFLDFDGADVDLWFLPLPANSIFGFLLFFGGSGRLLKYTGGSSTVIFLLSRVIGYVAAIIIQSIIWKQNFYVNKGRKILRLQKFRFKFFQKRKILSWKINAPRR